MDTMIYEAKSFKSVEDAEMALNNCKSDRDFLDWFKWSLKLLLTPGIFVFGVPVTHIMLMGMTKWFALPGSAKDTERRLEKINKQIDNTITKMKNDPDRKDDVAELRKLKKQAEEKAKAAKKHSEEIGDWAGNVRESDVYCADISSKKYIYECEYYSYLENKIDNEQRFLSMINSKVNLKEAVLLEASTGDKIKAKWNKMVEFLKGLFSKFIESMSNVLLSNREYLEKYKDIILNKQPKEDLKYSYTGDYPKAIKERLIKFEVPVFSYTNYTDAFEAEGDGALVTKIMQNASMQEFSFDESESVAENLKLYFTGGNNQQEGNFSDLNFTDMYNFCHNWEQVKKIVEKDQNRITQSTTQINQMIAQELKDADKAAEQNTNQENNNATNGPEGAPENPADKQNYTDSNNVRWQYSATTKKWNKIGTGSTISSSTGQNANKNESALLEDGMKITNTNPANQMNSTKDNMTSDAVTKDAAKGQAAGVTGDNVEDKVNKVASAADKWGRVCRAIVGAKLTAIEQIAKDYMDIIRAHVRSYGGKDLKNKADNRGKQSGTDYGDKNKKQQEEQKPAPEKTDQQQ